MSDTYGISAKIGADDSGFQAAFDRMQQGINKWGVSLDKMYEEGAGVFKKFGVDVDQFAGKLGISGEMLSAFVAVGIAAAELGKQILEIGEQFDEASSAIERATGASSAALAAMTDDFEKLMGTGISQDIKDVAAGYADLSVKLGLSGAPLDALTKNFAEFAEITGQTVKGAVDSVADVMNKWNISSADAPELLDQIARAAQLSGVSAATLTEQLKSGGAQFQELGLSLTDSTALLAAFGKDGVNAQSVLTGLRTAVKEYAKEGRDAGPALQQTFDQIKNATSPTEALTLAIKDFGARAGPEMANAIRSGKASIDDFKSAIEGAGGTVEQTAKNSQTLGEQWAATMNQVKSALAPLGDVLVSLAKMIVKVISDIITEIKNIVGPIFENLKTEIKTIQDTFNTFFDLIAKLIHGDWKGAWTDAQIIVLEMVKNTTDSLSTLLNVFIGMINNMIDAADKLLDRVGLHIATLKTVSLSSILGITQEIEKLKASLGEGTKGEAPKKVDLGEPAAAAPAFGAASGGASSSDSSFDSQWEEKAEAIREKNLEEQKKDAVENAENQKESLADILATAKQYDDQILASYTERIEKERAASLAEAKAKGADAQTVADINVAYDDEITTFTQEQADKRAEISKKYWEGESKEADDIVKKIKEDLKKQIEGPIGDTSGTGSAQASLWQQLDLDLRTLSASFSTFQGALQSVSSNMSSGFSQASSSASSSQQQGMTQFSSLMKDVSQYGPTMGATMYALNTVLTSLFKIIGPAIGDIMEPLFEGLEEIGEAVGEAILPILQDLKPILDALLPLFKIIADNLLINLTIALEPLVIILQVLSPIFQFIGTVFMEVASAIEGVWNGIANALNSISVFGIHPFNLPTIGGESSSDSGMQSAISVGGVSVSGYAAGTDYSLPGYHIVGEQGAELAYLSQGTKVTPAAATASALGKSTTIHANFYSPEAIDATAATRQLRSLQRQLAFAGSI